MMYRVIGTAGWLGALLAAAGCGSVKNAALDAAPADAPADGVKTCDPLAAFGAPAPVRGLAITGLTEGFPQLSPDELTIYFDGTKSGEPPHLYTAHRASRTEPFSTPAIMTKLNADGGNGNASPSADGLTLWLAYRATTSGAYHLYVATRASVLAEFGAPELAQVVNGADEVTDAQPFLTADGQELWFMSARTPSMDGDYWRARRSGASFAPPERVPELSSAALDYAPVLSADLLTAYVSSSRTGSKGGLDVWRSHRARVTDVFPAPTRVDELSTARNDSANWLSSDNCRIYGASDGGDGSQIYMASR